MIRKELPLLTTDALFNLPHDLKSIPEPGLRAEYLASFHRRVSRNIVNANDKIKSGKTEKDLTDDEKFAICVAAGLPWSFKTVNGTSYYPTLDNCVGVEICGCEIHIYVRHGDE